MSNRHQGMHLNADASAIYKMLDSGEWGVWCDMPNLRPGQSITVTTRSGQTKLEKLDRLFWHDDDSDLSLWSLR